MCRLLLMNWQAIVSLNDELPFLLTFLESSLGGHGNGVAALWPDGSTYTKKGLTLSPRQASTRIHRFAHEGADWALFHTRRATTAKIASKHCHPFRSGKLVLAHNGHDADWTRRGKALDVTDSQCITNVWGKLNFPIETLSTVTGVFIGFQQGSPFVIKGQEWSHLRLAMNKNSGAILFISELPAFLYPKFDLVHHLGQVCWQGEPITDDMLVSWQDWSSPSRWGYPSWYTWGE